MKSQSSSTDAVRRATGPRTRIGKRRSSMNAIRHGLLSQYLILEGESRLEFDRLHTSLRHDLGPQGAIEDHLVEYLATLIWRRPRFVAAETGMISRSPGFIGTLGRPASDLPHQSLLRACLKDGSTPGAAKVELVRQAMKNLFELSRNLGKRGFDFLEDLGALQNIYGNHDVLSGPTFSREFMQLLISSFDKERNPSAATDPIDEAVKLINAENDRLLHILNEETTRDVMYNSHASVIPSAIELDRLVRYETHNSREFDRTLNQLHRLQAARKGCSTSSMSVNFN